jgi:hypothetical protein
MREFSLYVSVSGVTLVHGARITRADFERYPVLLNTIGVQRLADMLNDLDEGSFDWGDGVVEGWANGAYVSLKPM